jgi:hypothetical protein
MTIVDDTAVEQSFENTLQVEMAHPLESVLEK